MEDFIRPAAEDEQRYLANGWWRNITFGDLLDSVSDQFPDKVAFIEADTRLTYRQLNTRVNALAAGLKDLGINQGDSVLLQLPNWVEFLLAFYALQKIGAVAVLLLPRHGLREIDHFARLTSAKAWILPDSYHGTDFLPVIEQVISNNSGLKHVINVRKNNGPHLSFDDIVGIGETLEPDDSPIPSDLAFIMPTGGTTGVPKAVPRTHNSAICDAFYRTTAREQTSEDTCLFSVPLEHNLGLAALNGTIITGGTIVFLDSTKPADFLQTIQSERVTCAPLVPTLLTRLVNFPDLNKYDLDTLKALYVGGAKTPPDVIQAVHDRIGKVYVGAFGMSEGTGCTTRLDDDETRTFRSVGKPCCPHDEYLIVDPEGNRLPANCEGELIVKGPSIFFGYLNQPEETAAAFTADGYFKTGDLAFIDDDGYIWISGRSKDLIIRGGENISPADIEGMIRRHPHVEDVAVIGVPDHEFGEKACAYIKTSGGCSLSLPDMVSFLRETGASVLQLPEYLELIDEIPLTNIGKPDKKALKEDFSQRRNSENNK